MDKEEKTGIIRNNKELDTTLLTIFGSVLALIVIIGLFVIHVMNPTNSLLSPEIIMAMLALPATLISFAMGKRSAENQNQNGGSK